MKEETKKENSINERWFEIAWKLCGVILIFIYLVKKPLESITMYGQYLGSFIVDIALMPGIAIILIGYMIDNTLHFNRKKQKRKVLIYSIITCLMIFISFILLVNSSTYMNIKDLKYVLQSSYCEKTENLTGVEVEEVKGKYGYTYILIKTENYEFKPSNYIVKESEAYGFKSKFDNVGKVKIKYLPNTKLLLNIEPVKS